MNCIYCLQSAITVKSDAHVFPEAIIMNTTVLPKGYICDSCNNYLKELDSALIAHNHIWPIIQIKGLPGKKGRPRKKLGFIERADGDQSLSFRIKQKNIDKISFNSEQICVQLKNPSNFEDKLFRRALHHIAYNFLALTRGKEFLKDRFDNARKYIRQPKKGEIWPYVQLFSVDRQSPVDAQEISDAPGMIIRLGIFHNNFFVDLLNSGTLHQWAKTRLPKDVLLH